MPQSLRGPAIGSTLMCSEKSGEFSMGTTPEGKPPSIEPAAGNGILNRRIFLEGAIAAGATGTGIAGASAEPLTIPGWMKTPGANFAPYGQPSHFEDKVVRAIPPLANPATPG